MPYLLLVFGLLIGAYALYRFFIKADTMQIKALFLTAALTAVVIALFYMALTGRLAAALVSCLALIPFAVSWLREREQQKSTPPPNINTEIATREDALEVLGLKDGASETEIKAAYQKLMKKVHPDHEGSEWMAAKLNQARDLLLGNQ